MQLETDEVFILHSRAFRETSQLTDLFSKNHGRLRVVHRGGKKQKMQPFVLAVASWSGKTDLKSLRSIESLGSASILQGVKLFSGLYINELLTKVLHEYDPHPTLFSAYQKLVEQLASGTGAEMPLRYFERLLLEELGYGYDYHSDIAGQSISAGQWYWFEPEQGFLARVRKQVNSSLPNWVFGETLQAIMTDDFQHTEARIALKKIHQLAFNRLLGGKPLNSSNFFKTGRAV